MITGALLGGWLASHRTPAIGPDRQAVTILHRAEGRAAQSRSELRVRRTWDMELRLADDLARVREWESIVTGGRQPVSAELRRVSLACVRDARTDEQRDRAQLLLVRIDSIE